MKILLISLIFCLVALQLHSQHTPDATCFHIYSTHTSFPDTGRSKGHLYDSLFYTANEHYKDSTVLIIAPKRLQLNKTADLIFWFHGWNNNVDSAAVRYELIKQFIASKRNAILVLAETARNAPDSYGGKLERPGDFKALTADVINGLKRKNLIPANCSPGHIILAGHSGAYRVIARIVGNGGLPIDEVMLFDSLYGETEIFMDWLKADDKHRFIHLYTDKGYGPKEESGRMNKLLDAEKISYFITEEKNLTADMYRKKRLIFIHSPKEHNDIVNPDNFRLMLENTPFFSAVSLTK